MRLVSTVVARRVVISSLSALVVLAALPQIGFAQSNPHVGTWKLNLAKSKYSPGPPPKSATLIYSVLGQRLRLNIEGIDAEGKSTTGEIMQVNDGNAYATTAIPGSDASAYRRVNASTVRFTRMLAGKVVQTGTRVVSADGKSSSFQPRVR